MFLDKETFSTVIANIILTSKLNKFLDLFDYNISNNAHHSNLESVGFFYGEI